MIRKRAKRKDLAGGSYLITDNKYDSAYFKVSELKSELHGGKNIFKIKGNSRLLEEGYPVEIEITMENQEQPIYHEVNKIIDSSRRRIISIYVYPEQQPGIATITIVGVARRRPNGRVIPQSFRGKRNVIWQREVFLDSEKPNITDIVFGQQPRITINEHVKSVLSESFQQGVTSEVTLQNQGTISYSYPQVSPVGGFGSKGSAVSDVTVNSTGFIFSSSMEGGTLTIPNPTSNANPSTNSNLSSIPAFKANGQPNPTDFTASIVQVINSTTARLSVPYQYEYFYTHTTSPSKGFQSPVSYDVRATYSPFTFTSNNYKIVYNQEPIDLSVSSLNKVSYANIILANIDPIGGDVYRTKISMRTAGLQTFDLLADEIIEAREMLVEEDNVFKIQKLGFFPSGDSGQAITKWNATLVNKDQTISTTPEIKRDSETLIDAMLISGSLALSGSSTRDQDYVRVHCTKPIQVFKDCNYTISFKTRAFTELDDERNSNNKGRAEMRVYLSGSAVDEFVPGLGARLDAGQLRGPSVTPVNIFNPIDFKNNNFNANPQAFMSVGKSSTVAFASPTTEANIPDIGANALPAVDRDLMIFDFTPVRDGTIVPVFQVKFGKWVVSQISIKSGIESGFTPNHTIIEARVPEYQNDDVLDFKIEFFNINGVRADLILLKENISFEGGNTYINNTGFLGEGIVFDGKIGA